MSEATGIFPVFRQFPCAQCGAKLQYDPGSESLTCPYCGHVNPIERDGAGVEEEDYLARLAELSDAEPTDEQLVLHCEGCGAECTLAGHEHATSCPFCGRSIVASGAKTRAIRPRGLLPFSVDRTAARAAFARWLKSLWFAPNALKRYTHLDDRLNGVYIPCWTYDAITQSDYTGMRGDDYWVTETYTTTVNGKPTTRTRQVRRTRWTHVSGRVNLQFNDVLVLASYSLPRHFAEKLEPWDLKKVVAYQDEYLSGFRAERYQIDLQEGFGLARLRMDPTIRCAIEHDIGGDHQQIRSVNTSYDDVTFKHLLLPVWVSAYRYRDRAYRFLINGRTGEVQGERPWSWWKIVGGVLGVAVLAGVITLIVLHGMQ